MEKDKVIHPSIGTHILLGGIWLAFFVVFLYGYLFKSLEFSFVLVSGVVLLCFVYWLKAESVTLTSDGIIHKSGFRREQAFLGLT